MYILNVNAYAHVYVYVQKPRVSYPQLPPSRTKCSVPQQRSPFQACIASWFVSRAPTPGHIRWSGDQKVKLEHGKRMACNFTRRESHFDAS